jgi:hypothetical protein
MTTNPNSTSDILEEDFCRYDSRAVQLPWLECVNGLPLRTPLADLKKFATAFCKEAKTSRRVPRPLRRSFEHMLALNRQVTPACPTFPAQWRSGCVVVIPRGGRGAGLLRTVGVEFEFETPTDKPPKAGTRLLFRLQKAGANPIRPASRVRGGNPFPYSSQGILTARGS